LALRLQSAPEFLSLVFGLFQLLTHVGLMSPRSNQNFALSRNTLLSPLFLFVVLCFSWPVPFPSVSHFHQARKLCDPASPPLMFFYVLSRPFHIFFLALFWPLELFFFLTFFTFPPQPFFRPLLSRIFLERPFYSFLFPFYLVSFAFPCFFRTSFWTW